MQKTNIAIGLGANLGNPEKTILRAVEELRLRGVEGIRLSSFYRTSPVDCVPGTPDFVNAALVAIWDGSAQELLQNTKEVELGLGRPEKHRSDEARVVDLDILLFGEEIISIPHLNVPHIQIQNRLFVLQPLAELVPELIHPVEKKTIAEILAAFPVDSGQEAKISQASYFYSYRRGENTLELAEAEATHVCAGQIVSGGVVEGYEAVPPAETAFLKKGAELLAKATTLEELREKVEDAQIVAPEFMIECESVPRSLGGTLSARTAIGELIAGRVNLKNPQNRFYLLRTKDGYWFGRMLPAGDSAWRDFTYKPEMLCNAAPLPLTRVAIELVSEPGDSLYDPCCGSGTIPLLAWSMGREVFASDKSWPAVAKSRKNLEHFGCPIRVFHADARTTEQNVDCIVCNPPYDLYCPVESSQVIAEMLRNFAKRAKKVAVFTSMDIGEFIAGLDVVVERRIVVKRHDFHRILWILRSSG